MSEMSTNLINLTYIQLVSLHMNLLQLILSITILICLLWRLNRTFIIFPFCFMHLTFMSNRSHGWPWPPRPMRPNTDSVIYWYNLFIYFNMNEIIHGRTHTALFWQVFSSHIRYLVPSLGPHCWATQGIGYFGCNRHVGISEMR